ncbi:hypothetical protein ZWY2020_029310 [Hordeum vulgare]|nr:hypothetical protein ZWY2020_029310 [Hordeum vulgare]
MRGLASSSYAASSSRVVEEDDEEEGEDEEDEERAEEEEQSDEEEEYDDDEGPPPTQTTQLEKRNVSKRDWASPSPFQRARPPQRKKNASETRSKKNEDRISKRGRSK